MIASQHIACSLGPLISLKPFILPGKEAITFPTHHLFFSLMRRLFKSHSLFQFISVALLDKYTFLTSRVLPPVQLCALISADLTVDRSEESTYLYCVLPSQICLV